MIGIIKRIWYGLTRQGSTMTHKVTQGVAWVGLGAATDQGLNAIQTFIIVRKLDPSDFGIQALAMVVVGLAATLTTSGVNQACIQRKEIDDLTLDTAWVMEMARNFIMAAILLVAAAPVASYYKEPRLKLALAVLSLRFVMMAFRSIGVNLLLREMNFRRHEVYQRIITLVGTATTVVLAFVMKSYWALIIGQVVYGFLEMVGSYMVHPYRPRYRFSLARAKELFRYGGQLLIGGIVGYAKNNLDKIMLGKILGVTALGYYSLMLTLAMVPGMLLTGPIWTVMFPAYSRLQGKTAALREAFVRALRLGMAVTLPACAGMIIVAPSLVTLAYTEKYLPAVPVFRVFCLMVIVRLLASATAPLFSGVGKPILMTVGGVLGTAAFIPAALLLSKTHQDVGVASARVIGELASIAVTVWFLRVYVHVRWRDLASAAYMPVLATAVMTALLLPCALYAPSTHVGWLIAASVTGAAIYTLFHLAVNSIVAQEIKVASGHFFSRK